jgi:hypothetical protein
VLVSRVVLFSLNNSFQNPLVNILSLSDMIDLGIPCNLTTPSNITCATCWVVNGCFKSMKCADLENLSTTTMMQLYPYDFGRPSMKSIVMSCQA